LQALRDPAEAVLAQIRQGVSELCTDFPVPASVMRDASYGMRD
jgi:hypothetical protein